MKLVMQWPDDEGPVKLVDTDTDPETVVVSFNYDDTPEDGLDKAVEALKYAGIEIEDEYM